MHHTYHCQSCVPNPSLCVVLHYLVYVHTVFISLRAGVSKVYCEEPFLFFFYLHHNPGRGLVSSAGQLPPAPLPHYIEKYQPKLGIWPRCFTTLNISVPAFWLKPFPFSSSFLNCPANFSIPHHGQAQGPPPGRNRAVSPPHPLAALSLKSLPITEARHFPARTRNGLRSPPWPKSSSPKLDPAMNSLPSASLAHSRVLSLHTARS